MFIVSTVSLILQPYQMFGSEQVEEVKFILYKSKYMMFDIVAFQPTLSNTDQNKERQLSNKIIFRVRWFLSRVCWLTEEDKEREVDK